MELTLWRLASEAVTLPPGMAEITTQLTLKQSEVV